MNLPNEYYIVYMFALLFSFYLGFTIILIYLRGTVRERVKYAVTAGLLSTKFIIFVATILGIDHLFFYIRIGWILVPVTANMILFISNLLVTISLNWDRIGKYFTITEEEYEQIMSLE